MPRSVVIASRVYGVGSHEAAIDSIPQGSRGFKMRLTREAWPVGIVAAINFELRPDGSNWQHWTSVNLSGGVRLDKAGQVATFEEIYAEWPGHAGPNDTRIVDFQTDVRATLVVAIPFTTQIAIEDVQ